MNRIGGSRRKARHKYTKERRAKGKISVTNFMQSFDPGAKVHLSIEPAYHKGMYHSRFLGKSGTVKAARGKCYEVVINDKGKEKILLVHPVHLKLNK
jgi:ribosomal protein L21E|tara:strand:+ start:903 stop:1193 length:291 start_codon:yes stop_codon:yes gene_type:complete